MYKHEMVETIGLYVSVYIQTAKWTQRDQFAVWRCLVLRDGGGRTWTEFVVIILARR